MRKNSSAACRECRYKVAIARLRTPGNKLTRFQALFQLFPHTHWSPMLTLSLFDTTNQSVFITAVARSEVRSCRTAARVSLTVGYRPKTKSRRPSPRTFRDQSDTPSRLCMMGLVVVYCRWTFLSGSILCLIANAASAAS